MFKTKYPQSMPWLEYIAPTQQQLLDLSAQYHIPLSVLKTALTKTPLSRSQHIQDWHWIVCYVPVLGQHSAEYQLASFSVFIRQQQLIIVSATALSFFDLVLQRQQHDARPEAVQHAVIDLLHAISQQFFHAYQQIDLQIMQVESELESSIKNQQIFRLLAHSKTLNRMANALRANCKMLTQLQSQDPLIFPHDPSGLELSLADVCDETQQALAMTNIQNSNLCNLMDAYAAAVENNLSMLVQYLSIYVILGAIPLGIASFFGMNTPLPWHDQPWALFDLALISILISGALLFILKKRQIT